MPSRSLRFPIAFLFFLTFQFTASDSAFGQGSKLKSEYEPVAEEDRDRPDLREEWMRNGRTAPVGESAAALRLRAHQQKMTMRARARRPRERKRRNRRGLRQAGFRWGRRPWLRNPVRAQTTDWSPGGQRQ